MPQKFRITIAAALAIAGMAGVARADELAGKMARFNRVFGATWTCETTVPAIGDRAPHTDESSANFEALAGNVLHDHISGADYSGDFYLGYNERDSVYWMAGADSLGMHQFLTSPDAITYKGPSPVGSIAMDDTITYTRPSPNKTIAHEVLSRPGAQTVFETVCSRN